MYMFLLAQALVTRTQTYLLWWYDSILLWSVILRSNVCKISDKLGVWNIYIKPIKCEGGIMGQ